MALLHGPGQVTDSLLVYLDSANVKSNPNNSTNWYDISGNGNHFTLFGSPFTSGGVVLFSGTSQYARSTSALNLTSLSSVTVETWFRLSGAGTVGMIFEHTADWNSNPGGFGLYTNSQGGPQVVNTHHTNHNTFGARNYNATIGTTYFQHVNIFSRTSDALGRITYVNSLYLPFDSTGGYATSSATSGSESFANAFMFLASRGGSTAFTAGVIAIFKVYGRKLSADEIERNYIGMRGRLGV